MPGSWEMFILEVHFLPAERPRGGRDVIFEEAFVYQTYSHPIATSVRVASGLEETLKFVITASDSPGFPLFCCLNARVLGAPSALGS